MPQTKGKAFTGPFTQDMLWRAPPKIQSTWLKDGMYGVFINSLLSSGKPHRFWQNWVGFILKIAEKITIHNFFTKTACPFVDRKNVDL